eukprot:TRINITY_DN1809_c0_g1_i1.p1 TRINITY_DN1809_c0_g1~~TRINITY_DN1809_c0_g1_i1.p1  ORF type:complete len:216 (-),score=22.13 TRINITY_DN1809_c0_g1_i1:113-676(-)
MSLIYGYGFEAESDNHRFFELFVKDTLLKRTKPSNYHVTVAWTKAIESHEHRRELDAKIREIRNAYSGKIAFIPKRVGRYTRSTPNNIRTHDNCPLVIYPTKTGKDALREINKEIWSELQRFNEKHGTDYNFTEDLDPTCYKPHITLVNKTHINDHHIDRDAAIEQINNRIKEHPFEERLIVGSEYY